MAEESAATEGKEVSRDEAQKLIEDGAQLIDVRADHEWEAGHIPGATHLPLHELAQRAGEVDPERPVVLYCRGGTRSTMAAAALADAGYDAAKLSEGVVGWSEAGLPLDPDGEGYVADSGEAAAVLQARKRAASSS
jgi:rhodanese-related sulfurtransferase